MSCPSCQVGGRRLPSLPLGYKYSKDFSNKYIELGSNIEIRNIGSNGVRSQQQSLEDHEGLQEYLLSNPNIIEEFVIKNTSQEQIEKWLIRKSRSDLLNDKIPPLDEPNNRSLSKWKFCVHKDKRNLLQTLTSNICENQNKGYVLNELAKSITQAVHATSYHLYFVDHTGKYLVPSFHDETESVRLKEEIATSHTVSAYVARENEVVFAKEIIGDDRFPAGTGKDNTDQSIICHPVTYHDNINNLYAVVEFVKDVTAGPFEEEDYEIVCSYMSWGCIAIHYTEAVQQIKSHEKMQTYVVEATRILSSTQDSVGDTLQSIVELTKDKCECDSYVIFMYDTAADELYSTVTNMKRKDDSKKGVKLRFPSNKGIAGHIVSTKEVVNVIDAYSNPYFLREIDQQTGSTTKTVLSVPLCHNNNVIGAIQLANKTKGIFDQRDESLIKLCSTFCSSIIMREKQNKILTQKESEIKLLQEILCYHGKPDDKVIQKLTNASPITEEPENFNKFSFNIYENTDQFTLLFLQLAKDMFVKCELKYSETTLIRFTAAVKKHYRDLPYHNWEHAFSVAHFMYLLLQKVFDRFTKLEALALFIACICHDLDHQGRNNAFVQNTNKPLATLYNEGSCLEHHHFYMTQHILQQSELNIFESLSEDDNTEVFSIMEDAILATDLLKHFEYREILKKSIQENSFQWDITKDRALASFAMITLSDLCGSCKPWEVHCESVAKVFEEFYAQADEEISLGIEPIPMFVNKSDLPFNQIGFLNAVLMPCVNVLKPIIPSLTSVEETILSSISRWESIIKHKDEEGDEMTRYGTPVDQKLEQLKVPGSKLQEKSLSFVRYNCSGKMHG